jgi:riboflavin synthase
MFTGIIEKQGRVRRPGERLLVETDYADLALGESVAVNGCCLTVVEDDGGVALFHLSPETLERTNLGALTEGGTVNLERALQAGARLSGHIVQGHVDGLARLTRVTDEGDCHEIELSLPPSLGRYCVEKGSIALSGVSLTINRVTRQPDGSATISLMIIPHTWTHTTLSSMRIGDQANVEVDILAKYVEAQLGWVSR